MLRYAHVNLKMIMFSPNYFNVYIENKHLK